MAGKYEERLRKLEKVVARRTRTSLTCTKDDDNKRFVFTFSGPPHHPMIQKGWDKPPVEEIITD